MSTYAIGDIHGNLHPLNDLLVQLLPQLTPDDTVVFLGDYVDRGPDSRGCVGRIIRLREEAPCPVITLLGNHEQWMLRTFEDPTRHSWLMGMEALDTISSYSPEAAANITRAMEKLGIELFTKKIDLPYKAFLDAIPTAHKQFFLELKPYHRTPDVICVHGGISLDGVLDPSDENVHVWGPTGFPEDYDGEERVVYGHRHNGVVQADGTVKPCIGSNRTYGIDTISYGILTAMRFPDGKVIQGQ
jgi:serine/threonine protein phosphatase 1